jgi:hypothetical protein
MRNTRRSFLSALLFTTLLGPALIAQSGHDKSSHDNHRVLQSGSDSNTNLVRAVREATRPFLDVHAAVAADYGPFLGCVSGTQEGAMGVHYVNGDFVGDGLLDAGKPEALMYERRNGRMYLLGVEFIVMVEAWHAKNAQPPTLMGQVFTYNGSPNRYGLPPFYALHVWAWRDNPRGTFVDWNPHVSCEGFTGNQ